MKDHRERIAAILDFIEKHQKFVLTTHVNPDGDGIGSELALMYLLKKLNKEVHIVNASPVPETYKFLDPGDKIFNLYSDEHENLFINSDAIIVLDISVMHRLGKVEEAVHKSKAARICIDHHPSNSCNSDYLLIDEDAVSTGELIYELYKQGGFEITKEVAEALFISILTDTGCFRFSNTNASAHLISAEMIETGIDHLKLYSHIYESNTWEKTLLYSRTFGNIGKEYDGRVAWLKVTRDMLKETGAKDEDTEGFVEMPRSIDSVQISILFKEIENNALKVSFRSTNSIPVDKLAGEFGGGGHKNAAATVIEDSGIDDIIESVLNAAGKYLY